MYVGQDHGNDPVGSYCVDAQMRTERVELSRLLGHQGLNLARLPIPPRPHGHRVVSRIRTDECQLHRLMC